MKSAAAILLVLAVAVQAQMGPEASYSLSLQDSLGMVSGNSAFAVDLLLAISAPISGFQVDFDVDGLNEVLPDEVVGGPVIVAAGYNIVFGSSAAVAFSFDLTEISPMDNPNFVALSFLFSNPTSITGQQFCIDEDGTGTVVSGSDAVALSLGFTSDPCVLLPDVILSLSATGQTVTVNALNVVPISGSQFFFTGPAGLMVTGASNGNLLSDAGFGPPAAGVDGALSFSLSGGSVPAQNESDSFISISFNLPGEYCVDLSRIVFSDPAGSALTFGFVDNIICFTLEELACPTAGTGDVNFDGEVNIQDVVFVSNELIGLGEGFDECQILSADVIVDGMLNVSDVVFLIALVLGNV